MFKRWFSGGKQPPSVHPWMDDIAHLIEAFGTKTKRTTDGLKLEIGEISVDVRF